MGMDLIQTVEVGNTITLVLTLKEPNGTPITNCTNHVIKVYKPNHTQSDGDYTSPTNNSDGTYTQKIFISPTDPKGFWYIEWNIVYNGDPQRKRYDFRTE